MKFELCKIQKIIELILKVLLKIEIFNGLVYFDNKNELNCNNDLK